uniref:HMG box domain-containing protein n=1 Tax=Ditylenchus dipsaci TaxID=166011 RepID=A0A915CR29_9BILA
MSQSSSSTHSIPASSTSWDLPAPSMMAPAHNDVHCSRQTKQNFIPVPSAQAINRRKQEQITEAGRATTARLISCSERTPIKTQTCASGIKKSPGSNSRKRAYSICSPSTEDDDPWLVQRNIPDPRRSERRSVQPEHYTASNEKDQSRQKKRQTQGSKTNQKTAITSSTPVRNTTPVENLADTGKKRKKVILARDKGLPPRPISAFFHFNVDYRNIIKEKSSAQGVPFKVVAKQLWKN